jgi:hypothetical protein
MFEIRTARPKDASAMGQLYVDAWRDAYAGILPSQMLLRMSPETHTRSWRRMIVRRGAGADILVADDPTWGIVGLASAGPCEDATLDADGEVYTLYVDPNHLGRGVGSRLLSGMFERIERRKHASAAVWALARNPARHFYEQAGGTMIARRVDRVWGARLEVVAYGWRDLAEARARLGPAETA